MERTSLVAQMEKISVCNTGNLGLVPVSGRFPGGKNGNPLEESCLGNAMDRGAWLQSTGLKKGCTQLSDSHSLNSSFITSLYTLQTRKQKVKVNYLLKVTVCAVIPFLPTILYWTPLQPPGT